MKLRVMNYIRLWFAFLSYCQVATTEDDKEKTTLTTNWGPFQFEKKCHFGQ